LPQVAEKTIPPVMAVGPKTTISRQDKFRLAVLAGLVVGITLLHYTTATKMATFHDIYRRLYYLPIVLGGLWFMLRGGMATAIAVTLLYLPHVVFQWGHHPASRPEQYLEILLYNIIGFVTGLLTQRERMQKNRAQSTAQQLEHSNTQLREQADLILDIEEQLRRADRLSALGALSASMAHEIRNPLGSIRGTAEILMEGIEHSDRRYEFAQILVKEVERLNQVVENFLRFARPASAARARFSVVELIEEIVQLTSRQAQKHAVVIDFDPASVPEIIGDAGQLRQAFLNLVLNAIQAMPDSGRLQILLHAQENEVVVVFRDFGLGIPAENLQKIFDPFFTTRREGIGLGLAITQRIIEGNGGRIEVESHVGEGTSFAVHLPVAPAATSTQQESS